MDFEDHFTKLSSILVKTSSSLVDTKNVQLSMIKKIGEWSKKCVADDGYSEIKLVEQASPSKSASAYTTKNNTASLVGTGNLQFKNLSNINNIHVQRSTLSSPKKIPVSHSRSTLSTNLQSTTDELKPLVSEIKPSINSKFNRNQAKLTNMKSKESEKKIPIIKSKSSPCTSVHISPEQTLRKGNSPAIKRVLHGSPKSKVTVPTSHQPRNPTVATMKNCLATPNKLVNTQRVTPHKSTSRSVYENKFRMTPRKSPSSESSSCDCTSEQKVTCCNGNAEYKKQVNILFEDWERRRIVNTDIRLYSSDTTSRIRETSQFYYGFLNGLSQENVFQKKQQQAEHTFLSLLRSSDERLQESVEDGEIFKTLSDCVSIFSCIRQSLCEDAVDERALYIKCESTLKRISEILDNQNLLEYNNEVNTSDDVVMGCSKCGECRASMESWRNGFCSIGIWYPKPTALLDEIRKSLSISYSSLKDWCRFQTLIQELQILLLENDVMMILASDVLPALSEMDPKYSSEVYEAITCLVSIMSPGTPLLVSFE